MHFTMNGIVSLVPYELLCLCVIILSVKYVSSFKYWNDGELKTNVIETRSGSLVGRKLTVLNRTVDQFLGIPYAKPPTGELRFEKPQPMVWEGVYEATKFQNGCTQYVERVNRNWWLEQRVLNKVSEDCLYLNLWIPSGDTDSSLLKPVLIWIHGGGFSAGSSDVPVYNGKVLAAVGDIIVVTLNYRLGIFGFLNLGTKDISGNMGLYDQLCAIQWVKQNAKYFGGDPSSITLAGQSAGAASVGLLMVSPLSKQLFKRAIMQSGAPYHPLAGEDPNKSVLRAHQFATYIGCANASHNLKSYPDDMIKCLRQISDIKLAKAVNQWENNSIATFYPIHKEEFLPKNPVMALKENDFTDFSLLIGSVRDEGSLFALYKLYGSLPLENDHFNLTKKEAFYFIQNLFYEAPRPFPSMTAAFYLSHADPKSPTDLRRVIYESLGDFFGTCPTVAFARSFAQNGGEAYFYLLTQRPSFSPWPEWVGVAHCDDIPFVFGAPFMTDIFQSTAEDRDLSMRIMKTWTTFVKTGKVQKQNGLDWPRFSKETPLFMEMNHAHETVDQGPHTRGCAFWKPMFDVANKAFKFHF